MSPQIISRRSTLSGLVVTLAGGVAGYFVARNSDAAKAKDAGTAANSYGSSLSQAPSANAPVGGTGGATGKLLAAVDQVPAGGGLILSKEKIVLTSGPSGTINGFTAICTHQGCTVDKVSNGAIACPCHGSRYDAQTGAVIAGPAPAPLSRIPVVVKNQSIYTT